MIQWWRRPERDHAEGVGQVRDTSRGSCDTSAVPALFREHLGAARERRFWSIYAVVLVLVAAGLWFSDHGDAATRRHGHPDPGGARLTALRSFAPKAVPPGVTGLRAETHRYRWDPARCDGDPPGWTNADVDMTFRAPSTTPAVLDAVMRRLNWRQVPDQSSSGPAPASPGPGFRVYEPRGANPSGEYADLTPPSTYGGGLWDLDVSVSPAEVPAHDC